MSRLYQRRYVVEVERVQRQQVTFVADPADDAMLTRIAVAYCEDDCWTETAYRHGSLTSEQVMVKDSEPDPPRDEEPMHYHDGPCGPECPLWDGPVSDLQTLEDLLHGIWLHERWRALTVNLTTEQKEAFADAVDRASARLAPEDEEPAKAERWWR